MKQDILAELGHLFLGSRLKRLAERLQNDAAKVIRDGDLPIQPAQFPLLAAIDRFGPLTVGQAVETLGVSQPAVTRSAASLIEEGILAGSRDGIDQRQKTLSLTKRGKSMMTRARTHVWPRLDAAVAALCEGLPHDFLGQVAALEKKLEELPLDKRVAAIPPSEGETRGLSIRAYSDELAESFYKINAEWIESMFTLEKNDIEILSKPRELIIDRGGIILFVEAEGVGIVGTCALIKIDEGCYELTKMGVSERARGRKAGEFLLRAMLERAASPALGLDSLYLLTSKKCEAAIHLYEKVGFVHDSAIMKKYGKRYKRCDVAMSYPLR